jgi:hypothetical protein
MVKKPMTISLLWAAFFFSSMMPLMADAAKAKVDAAALRIRETPDLSAKVLGSVPKGEEVSIVAFSASSSTVDNITDYWFHVRSSTGLDGWAFGGYLKINHERTSRETYEFPIDDQKLLRQGLAQFFDQKIKYRYQEGYDLEHPLLSTVYGWHGGGRNRKGRTIIIGFMNPSSRTQAVYWMTDMGKPPINGMWFGGVSQKMDFESDVKWLSADEAPHD